MNFALHFLDLSWNKIRDLGASSLIEALGWNEGLTDLALCENRITDHGVFAIGLMLSRNHTLRRLTMSSNQLGRRIPHSAAYATDC